MPIASVSYPKAPSTTVQETAALSDVALLANVSSGDEDALLLLYQRYSARVYPLICRILGNNESADETLQDVFFRIWNKSSLYDARQGTFLSWLLVLARNLALDRVRHESRRAKYFVLPSEAEQSVQSSTVFTSNQMENGLLVRQILENLPVEQRKAVEMSYFQGLTASEIAALLDEPVGTVKTRLRLGLRKLREALDVTREQR